MKHLGKDNPYILVCCCLHTEFMLSSVCPYAHANCVGVRQISVVPPLLSSISRKGGGGGGFE